MAQILRPSSTVQAGGWTANSSTLHGDTSDQSDSTYAQGDSADGTMILALAAGTDPNDDTNHVLYLRCQATGGSGSPEKIDVDLYQGTTLIENVFVNLGPNRGSIVEESATLANAADITDYSALRVHVIVDTLQAGETVEFAEIWLSTPDAVVPFEYTPTAVSGGFDSLIGSIYNPLSVTPSAVSGSVATVDPDVIEAFYYTPTAVTGAVLAQLGSILTPFEFTPTAGDLALVSQYGSVYTPLLITTTPSSMSLAVQVGSVYEPFYYEPSPVSTVLAVAQGLHNTPFEYTATAVSGAVSTQYGEVYVPLLVFPSAVSAGFDTLVGQIVEAAYITPATAQVSLSNAWFGPPSPAAVAMASVDPTFYTEEQTLFFGPAWQTG